MSNNGEIPEDIIVDNILSRLPVTSLCRFKSVSKPWRTLISDPSFVQTHLRRQNSHQGVIVLSPSGSLFSVNLDDSFNNDAIATKLDFPIEWVDILCCCNGLLLVADKNHAEFLVNPSTRSYKKLSRPSILIYSSLKYGLGYDSSLNDYKVLKIRQECANAWDEDNEGPDIYATYVKVYSLKSGSWRNINKNYPYDHTDICPSNLVFLNGHMHWITNYDSGPHVIAAFDLAVESYWDLPPPRLLDNSKLAYYNLTVLGGCLCMFGPNMDVEISVWVMKEYGVVDSWTEFKIFKPSNASRMTPFCFVRDGEVLLQADKCKLVVYDTKEGKGSDMVVHGYSDRFKACMAYVESLVSPNCSDVIQKQDKPLPSTFNKDLLRILEETYFPIKGKSEESSAKEGTYEVGSTSCSSIIEASCSTIDPLSPSSGYDWLIDPEFHEGKSYKDGLKDVQSSKL